MSTQEATSPSASAPAKSAARDAVQEPKARIGQSVLGQNHLVEGILMGLLANGNLLIESLPGLAKTRAVKTLAKHLAADLSRVQFTPDLLPSDVTGAEIYVQTEKGGQFGSRRDQSSQPDPRRRSKTVRERELPTADIPGSMVRRAVSVPGGSRSIG